MNTNYTAQKKYQGDGSWQDLDEARAEHLLNRVLERESWYAPRVGREPMTSTNEIADYLAETGDEINWDSDWYAVLRVRVTEAEAPHGETVEFVTCDCGHTIPRPLVMTTSSGTSCPDCYDRMSD